MSDFEEMTLSELMQVRSDIEQLIKRRQQEEKSELLATFRQMAKEKGLEFDDIAGIKSKTGKRSAPKYRNPDNARETWTGRGRKPAWIEREEKKGKTLESLAVD